MNESKVEEYATLREKIAVAKSEYAWAYNEEYARELGRLQACSDLGELALLEAGE